MKTSQLKKLYPILLITLVIVIAVTFLSSLVACAEAGYQQTLEMLQKIFTEANLYTFDEDTGIYTLYNEARSEIGYAFYGSGRGYMGDIVVLVGLEDKETIKGITVTQQRESYGYWVRLVYSNFFKQFTGLKVEDCDLKRYDGGGGQVDAVSGATRSSWGVVEAVRGAVLEKIKYID
ncbi:FMN-binding protein [Chloroflexota bacterium]